VVFISRHHEKNRRDLLDVAEVLAAELITVPGHVRFEGLQVPNVFGGNMDNCDFGSGSIVYMPVQTTGGLLSIGDGDVQGEGEVCLSGVETSLKGEVQIVLHKNTLISRRTRHAVRAGFCL
jgi:acetamidase/formamidase